MAIKTGKYLTTKEVFIDYPFEEVMFRHNHLDGAIYRKFYDENESQQPLSHDNQLFCDALLSGEEITQAEYLKGKSTDG